MKSKVILFCVLLFCSNIVDSIPHSEDLVRQRVNPLSNWQVNQNAPNGQYRDTAFTQTRNVNIQQEKNQDYYTNQERYNYDSNGYNRSPASSPSAEKLLVSYDSSADGGRLDPQRVKSYPSRTSQVGFDNQYRNQNRRSQNQYTNSAPSAGLIPDDERPLVTNFQEPYRGPVQFLPNYVPSSNRRFYQPGTSYLTRDPLQYPLTGDKKYVANSALPFRSSGPVLYENSSEDQVVPSGRKARPPGGRRYSQSIAPQSEIIYNEAPAIIASDTLTDQSENIDYAENYRSRSDSGNIAPITNYDDSSPVISAADNYSSDSKSSNDPDPYENYREGQAAASEVKARPIGGQSYVQSLPQSEIIYNEDSAVVATDTLIDQSENIKFLENYKSRSHLRNTAPSNRYDSSSLISEADNNNSDFIPNHLAHLNSKKEVPVAINKILAEKPLARRYANNYRSGSGWNNFARDDSSDGAHVLTETVEVKSGKYKANYESDNGSKERAPINTYSEASSAPSETELLNSGNNKYEESNDAHHGSNSPTPLKTNPKQNFYQRLTSGIQELNLSSLTENSEIKNILKDTNKRYLVVHPNGTVEYMDKLDNVSHQNPKFRLVHKRKNINDSNSDGVLTQQLQENLPNNIAKTLVPVDEYDPLPTNNQPAGDKKPTLLHVDQANPADEYDSNMSPPLKDQLADPRNLKSLPQPEKRPADNNNSKLLPPYVIPQSDDDNSTPLTPNEDQSAQNDDLKPLPQEVNQPDDDYSKPLTPHGNRSTTDENSKLLPQDGNQPADGDNPNKNQPGGNKPFHRHRIHHNKSKHSHVNLPAENNNSQPSSLGENQPENNNNSWPSNEHQSGDETDSISSTSKHSHNQPADYSNPNSSTTPKLLTYPENQQADDNDSKTLPAHETQSADENQPEEDKKSKLFHRNGNQPTDDLKSEPTPAVASKNDDQSNSTSTETQVIKTHKGKHIHRKSTTDLPVVSTAPCSDDTSEDQIITLSPIEQATDNVSDVPPVATTTTTTKPDKSSKKSDIINDANNKHDDIQDDTAQTYSTTTVSPSSSASPTDNISDDKTIGAIDNKNNQTNDKTVVGQVNRKKDNQTAVYNSSELFDTNTDVPAESDDYSSVTASPSVQNDVNRGDASGDNSLKLGQSETDVTITVSGRTANDSEDEIITINIEVSESTDAANSSGNDKSLVVSIDTNNDSDDDSKTPKPENCKKDHNSNDGRGKNVEIDMSNLKGEPTMWIRTTNQDFLDKLTAKNDTEFDVIYFFHMENQPIVEREKATTIYCNGTVVTKTTEITYAHKDDPTPTIATTTTTMQKEDYEAE